MKVTKVQIDIDHFSSTVRGLFLCPGYLARDARSLPLTEEPLPPGAAAVVEAAMIQDILAHNAS